MYFVRARSTEEFYNFVCFDDFSSLLADYSLGRKVKGVVEKDELSFHTITHSHNRRPLLLIICNSSDFFNDSPLFLQYSKVTRLF